MFEIVGHLLGKVRRAPTPALEIRCDDAGFSVNIVGSSDSTSVQWREITTVLAYKRDLFAFDLICLAFSTPEGTVKIDEQMQGWSELVEELPSRLPGTPTVSDWWERVAKPRSATCMTKLFER